MGGMTSDRTVIGQRSGIEWCARCGHQGGMMSIFFVFGCLFSVPDKGRVKGKT